MTSLPDYITKYLWDTDLNSLDQTQHSAFIIERVLEFGDMDAIKWVDATYPKEVILDVLKCSKRLSAKTGNFFALYYQVPKEELLCIRKPFTQRQNRF